MNVVYLQFKLVYQATFIRPYIAKVKNKQQISRNIKLGQNTSFWIYDW